VIDDIHLIVHTLWTDIWFKNTFSFKNLEIPVPTDTKFLWISLKTFCESYPLRRRRIVVFSNRNFCLLLFYILTENVTSIFNYTSAKNVAGKWINYVFFLNGNITSNKTYFDHSSQYHHNFFTCGLSIRKCYATHNFSVLEVCLFCIYWQNGKKMLVKCW